jgi:hypothetical protein
MIYSYAKCLTPNFIADHQVPAGSHSVGQPTLATGHLPLYVPCKAIAIGA